MMKINNNLKGCLILSSAAMIWGFAFVAQSEMASTVPPFLLNSLRSFIAVAFLMGLMLLQKARGTRPSIFPTAPKNVYDSLLEMQIPLTDGSFMTVTDYGSAGKLWNDDSKMAVWMFTKE